MSPLPKPGAAPSPPRYPTRGGLANPSIPWPGEANAFLHADRYNCTFPALVADWRRAFHAASARQTEPLLPFGFVQVRDPPIPRAGGASPILSHPGGQFTAGGRERKSLPVTAAGARAGILGAPILPCQLSTYRPRSPGDGFARLRWHQTADLGVVPNARLPAAFMAVAMDLGDERSPYGRRVPGGGKEEGAGRKLLDTSSPSSSSAASTPGISRTWRAGCSWAPGPWRTGRKTWFSRGPIPPAPSWR